MADPKKIIEYLDCLKCDGWRPCLICALIIRNQVALFKSNKYPGFEFLQGGIRFGELPEDTFERELIEELGYQFYAACKLPPLKFTYLFEDKMKTKVKDTVLTLDGKEIKPQGKHYIVFAVRIEPKGQALPAINSADTAFSGTTVKLHQCRWVKTSQAKELIKQTENLKKRAIARKALDLIEAKSLCLK